jgi:transcriptional regulator with XRE-family HTH domain
MAALAVRLRVTERTLRRWESGEDAPTTRHARRLARELAVTVEELGLANHDPNDEGGTDD